MGDFRALDRDLDVIPGTVSVWCGSTSGKPAYERKADEQHYAASLMKLAVLVAVHEGAVRHGLVLDREVPVRDNVGLEQRHDQDDEVWQVTRATPRWLAERMVTRSSNLATNVLLELVGLAAADRVWRDVGATGSRVSRAIGDAAAAEAGRTNLVTAADLARLLITVNRHPVMRETLLRQRRTEDLVAGLPPGTRVAHKNGWVRGVRHSAGVIFPDDAPPFVLVTLLTTPLAVNDPGDEACRIVSDVARIAWPQRHEISRGG